MMLKSTYKPAVAAPPLPAGWTEHTAPTGKFRSTFGFRRGITDFLSIHADEF